MTVAAEVPDNLQIAEGPDSGLYSFVQLFYRCVTPLHIGCGQDVGVVDLPVIRERTTGYPIVPGSGIRGSFRDQAERRDHDDVVPASRIFGRDDAEQAGCVSITDAKILLFPVRSHPGVFRWITCPFVLRRYAGDVAYFKQSQMHCAQVAGLDETNYAAPDNPTSLLLEEFPFGPRAADWTLPLAIDSIDVTRVVLVHDEVFGYFVRNATIVTQHNHLSAAKTVVSGQLFSVEAVPPETVFYGFAGATDERVRERPLSANEVSKALRRLVTGSEDAPHHSSILGGDEGTGLGLTRISWV